MVQKIRDFIEIDIYLLIESHHVADEMDVLGHFVKLHVEVDFDNVTDARGEQHERNAVALQSQQKGGNAISAKIEGLRLSVFGPFSLSHVSCFYLY